MDNRERRSAKKRFTKKRFTVAAILVTAMLLAVSYTHLLRLRLPYVWDFGILQVYVRYVYMGRYL